MEMLISERRELDLFIKCFLPHQKISILNKAIAGRKWAPMCHLNASTKLNHDLLIQWSFIKIQSQIEPILSRDHLETWQALTKHNLEESLELELLFRS